MYAIRSYYVMEEDTKNLGVPFMIIGDQTLVGYADDYSEELITAAIDEAYTATDRYDIANEIDLSSGTIDNDSDTPTTTGTSNSSSDATRITSYNVCYTKLLRLSSQIPTNELDLNEYQEMINICNDENEEIARQLILNNGVDKELEAELTAKQKMNFTIIAEANELIENVRNNFV